MFISKLMSEDDFISKIVPQEVRDRLQNEMTTENENPETTINEVLENTALQNTDDADLKTVETELGVFKVSEEDIDKETGQFLGDNDKLKFENESTFELLLIKPNKIFNLDWKDPNYLSNILNSDFVETVTFSPETFVERLGTCLEIDKYKQPDVKVSIFSEEPNYHYEIMYLQLLQEHHNVDLENQFALMLQNNGNETIFGNVLIMKSHVPVNNLKSVVIKDISKNDIIDLMDKRVSTSIIEFDNGDYEEKKIVGSMDEYAEQFFDEEDRYRIEKLELGFLKHNINIWFTRFEYGFENVCGNLLKNLLINKCLVFSLITDNVRGNLTMDEFNKIKALSTKLDNEYKIPEDYDKKEYDEFGREILKNKYRILETIYNDLK